MRRLLTAALVLAFLGMANLAQAGDKPDPTGTWKWTVGGGQTGDMTLKMTLKGDKLTGSMGGTDGETTSILDAKYKDGEISFTVVLDVYGQMTTVKKTGKVSGDTINGKTEFELAGQARSIDWKAQRVVAANPTGTWQWSATFNGQTREGTLKLKLEKNQLTGVIVGSTGEEKAIQDGKYKDGEISFTVIREINEQKLVFKNKSTLSRDTIKGTMEFKLGDEDHRVDWEAKRVKK